VCFESSVPHARRIRASRDLWERLKAFADADKRSIIWAARKAVKEFLERVEGED
jgi:predicted transcriptional regulator